MIGNGAGKRKNTVRMEKKIVMNKGKKENENFAILEPLEYIQKFWQNKNIKAGNGFMYHLVQLHHIEIISNKERIKKEKIRRNVFKKGR